MVLRVRGIIGAVFFSEIFRGFDSPALILYMVLAREKRAWPNVALSVFISPLILIALNPTWWIDPIQSFYSHYVLSTLGRNDVVPVPTFYLGDYYSAHAP